MTQGKLIDQHKTEIIAYWKNRHLSEARLEQDQQKILQDCEGMGHESKVLLDKLFAEQRAWREQAQKDELDLLLYAQAAERERHALRQPILKQISYAFGRKDDRGR